MFKKKNFLAIIPARLGSKRLKNKNIRIFKGKPLFAWSLIIAKKSKFIDDIFLSTESKKIYLLGKKYARYPNYLRPNYLSLDSCHPNNVILHVLKFIKKKYDYFIYLQPTSPLRTVSDVNSAIRKIIKKKSNSLVSVTNNSKKPNGAIYISKPEFFLKSKKFKVKGMVYYKMPKKRSIDIDYLEDFEEALKK